MSQNRQSGNAMYPHLGNIYISERLRRRLGELSHHPVTTVVAPMGYGKTTAIDWWMKRRLKADGDTVILKQMIVTDSISDFWSGFCRALRGYPELCGQMKALGFPTDQRAMSVMAELLEDALLQSEQTVCFVMDDLYILQSRPMAPLLLFLSRMLSERLHFVLLSRGPVFSDEERMRLGGSLYELTADDLRLDAGEVNAYAAHCGLQLSREDTVALTAASEGWISMVYLNFKAYAQSGRWMIGTNDIFGLIKEVLLKPLPRRQREFLVLIGITEEFTQPQAAWLWQHEDVGELLSALTETNAFITKDANGVYRCHHMLRQSARQEFSLLPEAEQAAAYIRLGDWMLEQKEYVAAELAYRRAGHWDGLLTALERDRCKSLNAEHSQSFFDWIADCPQERLLAYPGALVACMVKMFSFHNIPEIHRLKALLLQSLEQNTDISEQERGNMLGDAAVSESFLCYNNISAMSGYHRRAAALLSRPSTSIDQKGAWTFSAPSILMMYHRASGMADSENAEMQECMPIFYSVSGDHGSGAEHGFAADLFYERGQFDDADITNRRAWAAAKEHNQFSIMLDCDFLSMRMALLRGDFPVIKKLLDANQDWLRRERQYTLLNTLDMCQAFLYALLEHPEEAPRWLREGQLSKALVMFPAMPMLQTFYNQLLLAQGQWTALIARQEECEKLYGIYSNVMCRIWLHIQLAAALDQIGRRRAAMKELRAALDLALPDGIVMPFVESCDYISIQLRELQQEGVYPEELSRILILMERYREGKRGILREHFGEGEDYGLTRRELEIAQLAAQRKTNQEIAEALCLAEKTVKNQLSHIFDKLDINGDVKNKRLELEKILSGEK